MSTESASVAACECGRPVQIVKSGECLRCYHRRYRREHYRATPRQAMTDEQRAQSHRDAVKRWKERNPDKVRDQHTRYRVDHPDRTKGR